MGWFSSIESSWIQISEQRKESSGTGLESKSFYQHIYPFTYRPCGSRRLNGEAQKPGHAARAVPSPHPWGSHNQRPRRQWLRLNHGGPGFSPSLHLWSSEQPKEVNTPVSPMSAGKELSFRAEGLLKVTVCATSLRTHLHLAPWPVHACSYWVCLGKYTKYLHTFSSK